MNNNLMNKSSSKCELNNEPIRKSQTNSKTTLKNMFMNKNKRHSLTVDKGKDFLTLESMRAVNLTETNIHNSEIIETKDIFTPKSNRRVSLNSNSGAYTGVNTSITNSYHTANNTTVKSAILKSKTDTKSNKYENQNLLTRNVNNNTQTHLFNGIITNNLTLSLTKATSVSPQIKRRERKEFVGNTISTTNRLSLQPMNNSNSHENLILKTDTFRRSKTKSIIDSKDKLGTLNNLGTNNLSNSQSHLAVNLNSNLQHLGGNISNSVNNTFNPPHSPQRTTNMKVIVRFRPLNEIETDLLKNNVGYICPSFIAENSGVCNTVTIKTDNSSQAEQNINNTNLYTFDRVFDMSTSQEEIYNNIGKETIRDVLSGYNGTIFAYGQSGTGKTYTMYGNDIYDEMIKGIIPRIITQIFETVEQMELDHVRDCGDQNPTPSIVFQVKLSILQIYKEIIYDLLTGEKDLKIKEHPLKGIYVEGLSEIFIDSVESFYEYLQFFQERRVVSETKLKQNSSRSHSILILEITQTTENSNGQNFTKKGTLNLVDLAGSEKVSKTGAVGENLEQAKKINLSLSALGNVIHSLSSDRSPHVPYRDSKLTRILQESLGGNYKTSLIVTCSPHSYHIEETISTLKFAQRVKTIKNNVKMNIKLSYEELQKIIGNLKSELEVSNRKILRLRKIVEEDEIVDKDNNELEVTTPLCDQFQPTHFKFTECFLHKEKINFLTIQVDQLQIELKDRDETINKHEDEIRTLKEKIINDCEKENVSPFAFKEFKTFKNITDDMGNEQSELNLKELYNEINHKLLLLLDFEKNQTSNTAEFNLNYGNIFKNIQEFNQCQSLEETKKLLEVLASASVLQLTDKMNRNLILQNKFLQNENQLLINIIEATLKSNYELSQERNINNNVNVINSLYQSFKQSFVRQRTIQDPGNENKVGLISNSEEENSHSSNNLLYIRENDLSPFHNQKRNHFSNNCISGLIVNNPIAKKSSSIRIEKFITRKNLNIIKNMYNQNMQIVENSNVSPKGNYNMSSFGNNSNLKKTEKKLSRLKILQDFIVSSIKESENIKHTFTSIKEEFTTSIKRLEEIITNSRKDGLDLDFYNTDRSLTVTNIDEENPNLDKNKYDVEDFINEYIDSGSATRKFDGIALKYINNRMKWFVAGGLNAEHKITRRPLNKHLESVKADNSVTVEESISL